MTRLLALALCLLLPNALARDVPFVPTPGRVVDKMLEVAKVEPQDVVYDLGSRRAHRDHGGEEIRDLFEANIGEATVVTIYLLSGINLKLKPELLAELKPGTRVVSHAFDVGDWRPQATARVGASTVYYWVVP